MRTHYGPYGGQFVPDTLMPALIELETIYQKARQDRVFMGRLKHFLHTVVGRPTALTYASRLSAELGATVYLKREDLNHTGAHKINNTLGQGLLAQYMKKKRVIAETGAGQHGVATATVCAMLGLECVVYMGEEDMRRQALNVARMTLLGATVIPVATGSKTLKDATTEAIRDWLANVKTTHYIIGSALGPHPYPAIVRDFQAIIGQETRAQLLKIEKRLPDAIYACVGGGSNAIGIFYAFRQQRCVSFIACEAAGLGLDTDQHSAALIKGQVGVLHGARQYLLQTPEGQIKLAHSISAGLDYPGVSPELSHWKDKGRLILASATDKQALEACQWVAQQEGIIPALETAHAFAVLKAKTYLKKGQLVVVSVSGRGDKDMGTLAGALK